MTLLQGLEHLSSRELTGLQLCSLHGCEASCWGLSVTHLSLDPHSDPTTEVFY